MKILFYGNFNSKHSSENHYLKAFKKLGHEVLTVQEPTNISDLETIYLKNLPNLFFWVHTHGWHTAGIENFLQKLKKDNVPSVGYHLDLWVGLDRFKDVEQDPYWNIEYFFTVDAVFVPELEKRGIKAFYLPPGVCEDECENVKIGKQIYDVVFIGSKDYHPEYPYRKILIKWLEKEYGNKFVHVGRGGNIDSLRGKELNSFLKKVKIVVGDTLCKNFDYPYYLSDRVFEMTGRGAFVIHPYIEGIYEFFDSDEISCYKYNNFEDLKKKIEFYLKHEDKRIRIQKKGNKRTRKDHIYKNRLNYILKNVKNN